MCSREAHAVTLRLVGALPVTRYDTESFRPPFTKRWRGIGAAPLFHIQRNVAGYEARGLVPSRLSTYRTPKGTSLFRPKDQEGRAGRPVDGRAVGNPIKGFPFFTFSEMMLGV